MENKIQALANQTRIAALIAKHGMDNVLNDGGWHGWRELGGTAPNNKHWKICNMAAKAGLLEKRGAVVEGKYRKYNCVEYRATGLLWELLG